MTANTTVNDKTIEKYVLLVNFKCKVQGAVLWLKQSNLPALDVDQFSREIELYLSEYAEEVAKLEAK